MDTEKKVYAAVSNKEEFEKLTEEEQKAHKDRVILESHIFRTMRMVNRKEDIGFSGYWYLLCEVILNGKDYTEDIKLLIKAMQGVMLQHKIITHTDADLLELKKQAQDAQNKLKEETINSN